MPSRRAPFLASLVCLAALITGAAPAQTPAPPKADEKQARGDKPKADKAPAPVWRTYDFQVVSRHETPVIGATIRPWQVAYGRGSMGLGDELQKPFKTDAEGKFQIVIHKDAPFIATVEEFGIRSLAFSIDHPDFPLWSDYVPVEGDRKVVMPDPATVIIRVRPAEGNEIPRDLYPVPPTSDWSEKDGVVTVRRVDLSSKSASPWLRIVQAPEQQPQYFTDLINLREHGGPAISLDVQLKPAVRVAGYLAENASRPIKSGRALATVISGGRANGRGWWWTVATDIDADGAFVFESLPADDTVQIIALCEGWVSAPMTSQEVKQYGTANNFATAPLDDKQMQASNRVYPQLHRLTPPQIEPRIPMEATLSCLVTVVDDNGLPIPDVTVSFCPNQYWFDGGSQILGTEINVFTRLRRPGDKSAPAATKFFWADKYEQQTDAGGIALITGLPFGLSDGATLTREYDFEVSHDDYKLASKADGRPPDEVLTVKIEPGQIGQVTVRMQPK